MENFFSELELNADFFDGCIELQDKLDSSASIQQKERAVAEYLLNHVTCNESLGIEKKTNKPVYSLNSLHGAVLWDCNKKPIDINRFSDFMETYTNVVFIEDFYLENKERKLLAISNS